MSRLPVPPIFLWLLLATTLLLSSPAGAIVGNVVSVLDGDTIEVLHNRLPTRIRLNGIDCPEKGQAYGNKAKHCVVSCGIRLSEVGLSEICKPRV